MGKIGAVAGSQEFYFEHVKLKRPIDTQLVDCWTWNLELRGEIRAKDTKMRVINTYLVFKTMRLNEIT